MGAALGTNLQPGDVLISLGTSGVVSTVSTHPVTDPTGAVAGFADATGRWLPLVCTLNAMKVIDTMSKLLGVEPAQLGELAADGPPGAGGVLLVPYFDGERTPNRPYASGTLLGLRTSTTTTHVARAAVEGVVCGILDGLDALQQTGVAGLLEGRLLLVGGGARLGAFGRVLADLAQRPVTVPSDDEPAAVGACVQAAAVLLGRPPGEVASAWDLGQGQVIDPTLDPSTAEAVRAAYGRARDLFGAD
jgi:xylulokinase